MKKTADVNAVVTANQTGIAQQQTAKPVSFSSYMNSESVMKSIASTIQDEKKRQRFVTTLISTVTTNPLLASCDRKSIVSSALVAESLNLPTTPQLGFFYLVPFKNKAKYKDGVCIAPESYTATPVIGWKGYYQLAIRTGEYRSIEVVELREGEVKSIDRLTNKLDIEFIEDDDVREKTPVVGYYAEFELLNGFHKALYWSKKKMINHADTYSPAFSKEAVNTGNVQKVSFADYEAGKYDKKDEWKYSSFWYKSFDDQAKKTMLRQLISKYGIMSAELEKAFTEDEQGLKVNEETGEIVQNLVEVEEEPTAEEMAEAQNLAQGGQE